MNPDAYQSAQSADLYAHETRLRQARQAKLHNAAKARKAKRKNGGHK